MEFTGKIIAVLPARSGQAKSTGNPWMTQDYVIEETIGQYPKRMCFNVFGEDKIKQFNIQEGQELTVSFDINAREYQGRWYNDIRAWAIAPYTPAAPVANPAINTFAAATAQEAPASTSNTAPFDNAADNGSDLPF